MRGDLFPIAFGVVVSTVLSGTLVIAGLKAGITPGVSPLVILVAWGAFARRLARGGTTRFLNLAQVAGSAGMAVTAGVIFTAPLVQILYADLHAAEVRPLLERRAEIQGELSELPVDSPARSELAGELLAVRESYRELVPPVDIATLILMSVAGAFLGFGFVGLSTRKFLSDPTLPAPEARACETMIQAANEERERRPRLGRSLFAGLGVSFAAPLVVHFGLAVEKVKLFARTTGDRAFALEFPFTPIYIGIGGLLTLATALLVFAGSFLRLTGDWWLAGFDPSASEALLFPANSMRWVGGAAMTVAVAWSLVKFGRSRGPLVPSSDLGDPELIETDPGRRRWQVVSVAFGMAGILAWTLWRDGASAFAFAEGAAVLVMCTLMVTLGALLSLQIGSSASPVSGTIFVTTLVLSLVALSLGRTEPSDVLILTPLLVGACVAVCTANDSSQDYKTLQLCGVRVQDGFKAQILGLLGGAIVVPIVLYVAHEAYILGSEDLVAPQGKMFATLVDGLLLQDQLPWYPIAIGAAVGAAAVAAEIWGTRKGLQLPAMALAVGIYLPAYLGVGILIGALCRFAGERGRGRTNESILAAAGLITGAAALELLLGIRILAQPGWTPSELKLVDDLAPAAIVATALAGIAVLGALLYWNARPRREGDRIDA